jgi:hypothetical protein
MKLKDIISDLWLAFGVLGMAVGLALPFIITGYFVWEMLK